MTCKIEISRIKRDGATQARAVLSDDTVRDYAALMAPDDGSAPAEFPPVVVYHDGRTHWLADGFHRVAAAETAGLSEVNADVRVGGRDDAVWHAAGANARHGVPMSRPDRQRALQMLLAVDAYAKLSVVELASHVGVSERTVRRARQAACLPAKGGVVDTDGRERVAKVIAEAEAQGESLSQRDVAERAGVSRKVVENVQAGSGGHLSGGATPAVREVEPSAPPPAVFQFPVDDTPPPPAAPPEPDPVVVPDAAPAHMDAIFSIASLGREVSRTLNRMHREAKAEVARVREAVFAALGHDPKLLDTMRSYLPNEGDLDWLKHVASGLAAKAPVRVCPLCEGQGVSPRGARCIACGAKGWQTQANIESADALANKGRR